MEQGKGHTPIRTCITCGVKQPKQKLLRLVLDAEGHVVKDIRGNRPGRGAYVCRRGSCWGRLPKHSRLQHIFRTNTPVTIVDSNC